MNKTKLYYYTRFKLAKAYKGLKLIVKKPEAKSFPSVIQIEPSIKCNAKCIMCPHNLIKREKKLDINKIKSIIDECVGKEVNSIYPFNWNEPFLEKDTIEILRYIRKKLPKTKINIFTNCSVLTKDVADTLINERLLDTIYFSFDTLDPIKYKKIRGLDYNNSLKNALYFIKTNSKSTNPIETRVNFTILDENQKDTKSFKKYWKDLVDHVSFGVDDGRIAKPYIKNRKTNLPCSMIFNTMVILCNGDVVSCCLDYHGEIILGNVYSASIQEIWNSENFKKLRQTHINGDRNKIKLCKDCPVV